MPDAIKIGPAETLEVIERAPERLVFDARWGPASAPPPAHYHPAQDERFEVLEGELTAEVDGERRLLGPGATLEIARGSVHRMWNAGEVPARARWETLPAGRTEEWFVKLAALLAADPPDLQELGRTAGEYDDTFRLAA